MVVVVVFALLGAAATALAYRAGTRRNRDRDRDPAAPEAVINEAFDPLPPIPPAGFGAAGPVYEEPDWRQPAIYDENERSPAAGLADYDQVARAVGGAATGTARAPGSEHLRGEPVTVRPEGPYSIYNTSGNHQLHNSNDLDL